MQDFTLRKVLGEVSTGDDYKWRVSLETSRWSGADYFIVERGVSRSRCPKLDYEGVAIPIQYANEIGILLMRAHMEYAHDETIVDSGKVPQKTDNYMDKYTV